MTNIDIELNALIGKIIRVDIKEFDIPLYGKLIEVALIGLTLKGRTADITE